MRNRCDICITEDCKKKGLSPGSCSCSTCKNYPECPKILGATIRITNRCTQECSHCCFSSSPKSNIMMSLEMAKKIRRFVDLAGIERLNIMGGEFFCNPRWYDIMVEFFESSAWLVRIVSNGDWYENSVVRDQISILADLYREKMCLDISEDRYHTNRWKESDLQGFISRLKVHQGKKIDPREIEKAIIPIGRSWLQYSFYSSLQTYCSNPFSSYSFLIDEEGWVYKCPFGVLRFTNIQDHLEDEDSFRKKFKIINQKFRKIPLLSCGECIRCLDDDKKWLKESGREQLRRE